MHPTNAHYLTLRHKLLHIVSIGQEHLLTTFECKGTKNIPYMQEKRVHNGGG